MKGIKVFSFIVKYLWFLKVVPLLPHVFDALLRLWSLLTNVEVLECIDEIETEIMKWEGMRVSVHKYGGLQFDYKQRELGHIHSNGLIDISLSRSLKKQLLSEGRISNHHVYDKTGWISFLVKSKIDMLYAISLFEISYEIKKTKSIQQNLL